MRKDNVIDWVRDRVNSIVFDSNTFIYAKATTPNAFRKQDYKLGGGNFLTALGIFTSLGFIAKTYVILTNKIVWKGKKNKEINETEAIWTLILDMPDEIGLGLPKDKQFVTDHWKQIRHALVHMNYPKLTVFSWGIGKDMTYEEIVNQLNNTSKKPFFKFGVRIELLAVYLYKILDWMESDFKQGNYQIKQIKEAANWIKDSLYTTEIESKNRERFWQDLED